MGHDHHNHSHSHAGQVVERALWIALLFNFSFLGIEVAVGLWSNSLALLSDAGHMVSDVAALAMALLMQRLAQRKPTGGFTYGLKRAPVLGAFGNSLTLLAIVALIFWEATHRLVNPPNVPGLPVLLVGLAGLFVNVASAWWLYRSSDNSLNVRGAILHLAADAVGSLGAIIAALVLMFTGWTLIDPIISFLIGFLILYGTWPLLRDSTKVLLEAAPSNLDVDQIRELLLERDHIIYIQDLHLWELDSGMFVMTGLLETDCQDLKLLEVEANMIRSTLHDRFNIEHCTIEWRSKGSERNGCEQDD